MNPATPDWKRVPSSTEFGSPSSILPGTVVGVQMLHGQVGGGGAAAAVVKVHCVVAASALPARSFTRGSVAPPLTSAVYVVETASGWSGRSMATRVTPS